MSYSTLGALIRVARKAAGLEQSELADRMEVRQQAVSGWERGVSRPRRSQLSALCAILDLGLDDVLTAGQYESSAVRASQNRLLNLPFENLSDEAFEAFCRDLLQMRHPKRIAVRNGSSGHKQYGVDVYVDGEGERIGVQCKRHKSFGPADVRTAIGEVLPDAQLTSGIIALSRRAATPAARLEIAKNPGWTLWDGETLSGLVRGLSMADKLALVESYFPALREPFLGIPEPSPWLEPERYDAALAGKLGVDRNFELVGRAAELEKLAALVAEHRPVILLVGRGGIGKSRLLREFASTEHDRLVRFAARGAISSGAYDLLPGGAPVIVVDDATDAEHDVSALVHGILRTRPDATVILATRPRALTKLRVSLEPAEPLADDITVRLGDLPIEDAETLARDALGDLATTERVESLARAGYDCPFLIVTGAHLVRAGRLSDNDLASQTVLRRQILTRFTDLVLKGSNSDDRTAVLQALSAIQPAPLEDADFLECLVAVSGLQHSTVLEIIDELEDLGLVLRRGKVVRVVPDLLGDATLERALVSESGIDKRFARKIADHGRGRALTHAIHNVSIVDWHRRAEGESKLAEVLWTALTDHARDLPNSARIALGKRVAAVAAIYPNEALTFADDLLDNPAPDEVDELSGIWGVERIITTDEVARSLAPLIANAGHRIEHLGHAVRRLLDIGLRDNRRENSNPDHALRLARELGEFHPRRPVSFAQQYVAVVGEMLRNDEYPGHRAELVSLLTPALARDTTVTEFKGISMQISRVRINLDAVAQVRAAALSVATECLSDDLKTAYAAIEILKEALHSGDHAEPVTEEFATVVATLRIVLADPERPAGLRLAAYRALGWHATYGDGERRELARAVRKSLAVDDDIRIVRLLRAGWEIDEDDDDEHGQSDPVARYHRSRELADEVAGELTTRWAAEYPHGEIVERIRSILETEYTARDNLAPPDGFLARLFTEAPDAARVALADRGKPGPVNEAIVRAALLVLLADGDAEAEAVATEMIAQGADPAKLVASAVMNSRSEFNTARKNVVRTLLTTSHPDVHQILLSAARWLSPADPRLVLDMLEAAPIESSPAVADAAMGLLTDGGPVPWKSLSPAERQALLNRFAKTPRLGAYEIGQLLNQEIALDPFVALLFLQQRIEHAAQYDRSRGEYEPLPHLKSMGLKFAVSPQRSALIQATIEWILADDSWKRRFYGQKVLEPMVAGYDDQVRAIILGLVRTRDEKRLRLAEHILDEAPRDFVLQAPSFVAEALEAAGELEPALAIRVRAGLHGSAEFGMRSRSIGVDDPAEVALRDGARALAERHPPNTAVRGFYLEVAERASRRLASAREDDLSFQDPRSWE